MSYLDSFLATHWPSILTVVICFLTILTAFKILNIDFNPVVDKRINKIIRTYAVGVCIERNDTKHKNGKKNHKNLFWLFIAIIKLITIWAAHF